MSNQFKENYANFNKSKRVISYLDGAGDMLFNNGDKRIVSYLELKNQKMEERKTSSRSSKRSRQSKRKGSAASRREGDFCQNDDSCVEYTDSEENEVYTPETKKLLEKRMSTLYDKQRQI